MLVCSRAVPRGWCRSSLWKLADPVLSVCQTLCCKGSFPRTGCCVVQCPAAVHIPYFTSGNASSGIQNNPFTPCLCRDVNWFPAAVALPFVQVHKAWLHLFVPTCLPALLSHCSFIRYDKSLLWVWFFEKKSLSWVKNTWKKDTCQLWLVDMSIGKRGKQGWFQWLTVLLMVLLSRGEN